MKAWSTRSRWIVVSYRHVCARISKVMLGVSKENDLNRVFRK